ncbi:MAG TPA: DUF4870 domain-containing protein [Anaerolineales bacterium]
MTNEPYPPVSPGPVTPGPLSQADERNWAMISHLSILLNLVTGFLGPLVPLVIYLVFKERSRYLAYQSMQAFVFQMVGWVGAGALAGVTWAVSGVLTAVLIGLLCIPLACLIGLIPLAALVYGVIAGVKASQGEDFKYWLIGDWVRGTLTN